MKRSEFIINITIGAIGSIGQAGLLAHALGSYPFRILSMPPATFYSSVGWTLFFIAPALSLLALYFLRSVGIPFVTTIPVTACPLIFWTLFRLAFLFSGYNYLGPLTGNNDIIAHRSIETDFSNLVLSLTVGGFVVGIVCGFAMWLLFRNVRRQSVP
jgi:hypothetical protein